MARSLAYPIRLNSRGALVSNEQDSDADVANGLLFAAQWTQGEKRRAPGYGRPPIEFAAVDSEALAEALAASEPRARTRGDLLKQTLSTAIEQIGWER